MMDVFNFFSQLVCPKSGQRFFVAECYSKFCTQMWYVCRGYLSDPPNVDLYRPIRTCKKTGFVFHECLRGSLRLEGSFLHLRLATARASLGAASPKWLDHIGNDHEFRQIVDSLRRRGRLPPRRHYDLAKLDLLVQLIPNVEHRQLVLGDWVPTKFDGALKLRHGNYYGQVAIKVAVAVARQGDVPIGTNPLPPSLLPMTAAARAVLGNLQMRLRRETEDTQRIMAEVVRSGGEINADSIALRALRHQFLMMRESVALTAENIVLNQEALSLLGHRKYSELQKRLRLPVPAPAIIPHLVPPTDPPGAIVVATALPVPLAAVGARAATVGAAGAGGRAAGVVLVAPAAQEALVDPKEHARELARLRAAKARARKLAGADVGAFRAQEAERIKSARKRARDIDVHDVDDDA